MVCENCRQEYDEGRFKLCPFCGSYNITVPNNSTVVEDKEKTVSNVKVGSQLEENIADQCIKIKEMLSAGILTVKDLVEFKDALNLSDGETDESSDAYVTVKAIKLLAENGEIILEEEVPSEDMPVQGVPVKDIPAEEVSKEHDNELIEKIYYNPKYRLLLDYCREHNIVYMSDLDHFDFYLLKKNANMNGRMVSDIMGVYEDHTGKKINDRESEIIFKTINEQYCREKISFLKKYGISSEIIFELRLCNYNVVADLYNARYTQLRLTIGENYTEKLQQISKDLQQNFDEGLLRQNENYEAPIGNNSDGVTALSEEEALSIGAYFKKMVEYNGDEKNSLDKQMDEEPGVNEKSDNATESNIIELDAHAENKVLEKNQVLIKDIFRGNKYPEFLNFCKINSLTYMSELEDFDFNRLFYYRGIKAPKYREVLKKYSEYIDGYDLTLDNKQKKEEKMVASKIEDLSEQNDVAPNESVETPLVQDILLSKESGETTPGEDNLMLEESVEVPSLKDDHTLINDVFAGNTYNVFKRYCKDNSLTYMSELEGLDLYQFINYRGVGIKKYEEVLEKIREYIDDYGLTLDDIQKKEEKMMDTEPEELLEKTSQYKLLENDQTLIKDVFAGSKYNAFRRYCSDNNLTCMSELEGLDFYHLRTYRGIGIKKYEEAIKRLREYTEYNGMKVQHTYFSQIHEEYLKKEIDYLSVFGIDDTILDKLKGAGYQNIGDLKDVTEEVMEKTIGTETSQLFSVEKKLQGTPMQLLKETLDSANTDRKFNMYLLRAEGLTLEQVAAKYGVTRERVRQIEKKYHREISKYVNEVIRHLSYSKNYVSVQEILDLYDNTDYGKIILKCCKNNKNLEYLPFAEVFVNKPNQESVADAITSLAKDFVGDEGLNFREAADEIENIMQSNGYPYMDITAVLNMLKQHGYKKNGDYLFKGKQSYGLLCAVLVAKHFPDGIKIYDSESLNLLRQYVLTEYGDIGIPDEDRAFSTRVSDYLVLSKRGEYTASSNVYAEMSLMDEIKKYIDESPEEIIYYSELFSIFESRLKMMSNIDNYHFLHGVLKLYYPDDYNFSQKDYLTKKGNGYLQITRADKLLSFIREKGKPVYKRDIMKNIHGLTDIVLSTIVSENNDLIQWDYNMFYLISELNLDGNDISFLDSQINEVMIGNKGYCSDKTLFDVVYRTRPEFIKEKGIDNSNNLFYICHKILKDNYDFRKPHIIQKGLIKDRTFNGVIEHLLDIKSSFSYDNIQKLAKQNSWSDGTLFKWFTELEKDYIRISLDDYIISSEFQLSDNEMKNIEAFIASHMSQGYLSLINFDEWMDDLPEIRYDWNVFLFRTVIDRLCGKYKVIEPQPKDRRYERGIVVYNNSGVSDFDVYIAEFIKKQGITEITEKDLETQLLMNNLIYSRIPNELYCSDVIKYRDGLFQLI